MMAADILAQIRRPVIKKDYAESSTYCVIWTRIWNLINSEAKLLCTLSLSPQSIVFFETGISTWRFISI